MWPRRDEHPTGMMCGGNLVARPISPLKEALAATLMHLGGVLPPHLGYNPRAHAVTHDWLWSVGAHPLSFTSTGAWPGGRAGGRAGGWVAALGCARLRPRLRFD